MTTPVPTSPDAVAGCRVTVVGLARSGRAVTELLARHGARVRATDARDAGTLALPADWLDGANVELLLGPQTPDQLADTDWVVVSPGIPKTAPLLAAARERGLPMVSELEVASWFARAPIAAVTGTNGKSTTVTVLGQLLDALDRPHAVAGNVGRALSEAVETVDAAGALVVEVSSFQLEDIHAFHPRTAAVLNVTPDHLDRYRDLEDYRRTKLRIFENNGPGDTVVLPVPDAGVGAVDAPGSRLEFGPADRVSHGVGWDDRDLLWIDGADRLALVPLAQLGLPGPHNRSNLAAAVCLLAGLGEDPTDPRVAAALRTVRGLPHRLEPVGKIAGVLCINDSKATNPESLAVALDSYPAPVVLIAGGRPKGGGYEPLWERLADRVRHVFLIGEATPMLARVWSGAGIPIEPAGELEAALDRALAVAGPGTTLLFSPGCASFDQFRDYEDRGDRFRAMVAARGGWA